MKQKRFYRNRGGCLSWILFLAACFFLLLAVKEYYPFLKNDIRMKDLQEEIAPSVDIEDVDDQDFHKLPKWAARKINWKKLHKINPDIIAWIHVPGTKIDYPVLHCHKWNEYLHKDYKGESSKPGSVFIQPETSTDFKDFHSIIFGHNMRNRSMFGSLHQFQKKDFWKKHGNIYIYQPDKAIKAQIYSAYDCLDLSQTYNTEFKDAGAKEEWIQITKEKSDHPSKRKVNADDSILTLSTCSNGGPKTSRYVVHSIVKEMIQLDE